MKGKLREEQRKVQFLIQTSAINKFTERQINNHTDMMERQTQTNIE